MMRHQMNAEAVERATTLRAEGMQETAAFIMELSAGLTGERAMDQISMMAGMATAIERLERRIVSLEVADGS